MRFLLILLIPIYLASCGLFRNRIDSGLNPYLGKPKDEYVKGHRYAHTMRLIIEWR